MFRAIAALVIVFFLLGVYSLAWAPVEDVASHVEENEAVKDQGWGDKVDPVRKMLFMGVPLFVGGGVIVYTAVWMLRKEKFEGRRGLR